MEVALSGIIISLYLLLCSAGLSSSDAISTISNIGPLSSEGVYSTFELEMQETGENIEKFAGALDQIGREIDSSACSGMIVGYDYIQQVINTTTGVDVANLYGIDNSDVAGSQIGDWAVSFTVVKADNYNQAYSGFYTFRYDAINVVTGENQIGVFINGFNSLSNNFYLQYSYDLRSWFPYNLYFKDVSYVGIDDIYYVYSVKGTNDVWRTIYFESNTSDSITAIDTTANTVDDYPIGADGSVDIDGAKIYPNADGTYTINGENVFPNLKSLNLEALAGGDTYQNITNNYIVDKPDLSQTNGLLGSIINTLTAIKFKLQNFFSYKVSDIDKGLDAVQSALNFSYAKGIVNTCFYDFFRMDLMDNQGNFKLPSYGNLFAYHVDPPHLELNYQNADFFGSYIHGYYDCYEIFSTHENFFRNFRGVIGVLSFCGYGFLLFSKIGKSIGSGSAQ